VYLLRIIFNIIIIVIKDNISPTNNFKDKRSSLLDIRADANGQFWGTPVGFPYLSRATIVTKAVPV
jgi:hypothetical protein